MNAARSAADERERWRHLETAAEILGIFGEDRVEELIDAALEYPSRRLVVYGSLAPGQPNHHIVSHMAGHWVPCTVRGSVTIHAGYKVLTYGPDAPATPALLFTSEDLPTGWAALDEFEGDDYLRILTSAVIDYGEVIANVYVGRRSVSVETDVRLEK